MSTLIVAILAFVGFILAYHTYGRWLSRRIFNLDGEATTPSHQLRDNVEYIPTKREVIFGHHFTSIAGTGPIVGPAIAVFWGWLPALLWVVFGSIFIGAVHDFGALVVSLRNRGQTVGEVAGRLISPRARVLFLVVLAISLTIVLAIFGLVIAAIFSLYPESVLSVWIEIPVAIAVGYWVHRRGGGLLLSSLLALGVMYGALWLGVYYLPVDLAAIFSIPANGNGGELLNAVVLWTIVLMTYCFIASVLPVWVLLQPRDFINSHQLMVALVLLVGGLFGAALLTSAPSLTATAPAIADEIPADAPPIFPFLFITIACGAISGFHCLVSSGTSSKQIDCETDAQYVGYGAMLLEGALAVLVILACCAGVGMGAWQKDKVSNEYVAVNDAAGQQLTGQAAWRHYYQVKITEGNGGWANHSLGKKVGAFIEGGANFIASIGVPLKLAIGVMAVLVASFAATTLDTATRLQRYVLQELSATAGAPLNKYAATAVAVSVGTVLACSGAKPGAGGMLLWPLFGATNQLLAGLAFMVTVFYLWRRGKPILFAAVPMVLMLLLPAWAMTWKVLHDWLPAGKTHLVAFGVGILGLQIWMIIEGVLVWQKAKGVLEPELPPLTKPVPSPPLQSP